MNRGGSHLHTGHVIQLLRKQKNLTQEELGKLLGVKKSAVQKYESGVIQNFKMETIRKLCEIFDVTPIVFISKDVKQAIENFNDIKGGYFVYDKLASSQNKTPYKYLSCLNDAGLHRVIQYMEDLLKIDEYQDKDMIQKLSKE